MADPWEIAPVPTTGDATFDITAAAKGRATSSWESVEVDLSQLYAVLTGHNHDDQQATHRYGEPLNFKDRLVVLNNAGEAYFTTNCSQPLEADFHDIVTLAREFSARRNEIVHSIVRAVLFDRDYEPMENGGDKWIFHHQFYLVPPTYTARKFDHQNRPSFIYASAEIKAYEDWFTHIAAAAQNLTVRLHDPSYPPYGRKHARPDP